MADRVYLEESARAYTALDLINSRITAHESALAPMLAVRSDIHLEHKRPSQALQDAERAVLLDPLSAKARESHGSALFVMSIHNQKHGHRAKWLMAAAEAYRSAHSLDPTLTTPQLFFNAMGDAERPTVFGKRFSEVVAEHSDHKSDVEETDTAEQHDHPAASCHSTTKRRARWFTTTLLLAAFLAQGAQAFLLVYYAWHGGARGGALRLASWIRTVPLPPTLVVLCNATAPILLGLKLSDRPGAVDAHIRRACVLITIGSCLSAGRYIYFFEGHEGVDHRLVCADALILLAFGCMCTAFAIGTAHLYCSRPATCWPTLRMGACVAGLSFLVANTLIFAWLDPPRRADGTGFIPVPGSVEGAYGSAMVTMGLIALFGILATEANREWLMEKVAAAPSNPICLKPNESATSRALPPRSEGL
jgi:hypothetical protein